MTPDDRVGESGDAWPVAAAAVGVVAVASAAGAVGLQLGDVAGAGHSDLVGTGAAGSALLAALAATVGVVSAGSRLVAQRSGASRTLPMTALVASLGVALAVCVGVPASWLVGFTPNPSARIIRADPAWEAIGLPIGAGRVLPGSDPTFLVVHYDGNHIAPMTSSHDRAIRADGWSTSRVESSPTQEVRYYRRGDDTITLMVLCSTGETTAVVLNRY